MIGNAFSFHQNLACDAVYRQAVNQALHKQKQGEYVKFGCDE